LRTHARALRHAFAQSEVSIHEFSAKALSGAEVSLAKYKGRPMLVENVATL
jgi:glutathione peroxidase-family protein